MEKSAPKIILPFLIILLSGCAAENANPIGASLHRYIDAHRRNWNDKEAYRPLTTTIWYPARLGSVEKRHNAAIFDTGAHSKDAEIRKSDTAYPLIILSHGTGGSSASIAWFAEILARNGYVVASVNHHGNTGAEPSYLINGFVLWWERARDITEVIDRILDDPRWGKVVDRDRIAVAGFSLGAYAALATIGATLETE